MHNTTGSALPNDVFARRVRARLRKLKLNQRELAGVLNVSESTISRWLDGSRRLSVRDLERLALTLHCSPGWLLGEDEAGIVAELTPA